MDDGKDITNAMLNDATIGSDVEKFKQRCLANPLVRDCDITIDAIRGKRREGDNFDLDIAAHLVIKTKMMVSMRISGTGSGTVDADARQMTVHNVAIDQDIGGVLTKILSMAGYVEGARIRVAKKDIEVLRRELN